jgi:thioesterase domain-containing protein
MTVPVAAKHAQAAGAVPDPSFSFSLNGVRLQRLRANRADETLFLVPGLAGNLAELNDLVSAFTGPQEVYGVAPLPEDAQRRPVVAVERMAQLMVTAIRQVQPSGPYRLGGYSFGSLLALEMAQQLRADGESVEALFLIDAIYDERYWPRRIWLRAWPGERARSYCASYECAPRMRSASFVGVVSV